MNCIAFHRYKSMFRTITDTIHVFYIVLTSMIYHTVNIVVLLLFCQLNWNERRIEPSFKWHHMNVIALKSQTMWLFVQELDQADIKENRADSRLEPSQWKTSLQNNTLSHWLGANLESALENIKALCYRLSGKGNHRRGELNSPPKEPVI